MSDREVHMDPSRGFRGLLLGKGFGVQGLNTWTSYPEMLYWSCMRDLLALGIGFRAQSLGIYLESLT